MDRHSPLIVQHWRHATLELMARCIYIAATLLLMGALVAVLVTRPKPTSGPVRKVVLTIKPGLLNEVMLQGKVRPQHVIGVAANVPGFVETFLVDAGQNVYQGQVLARIGAQRLESAREAALAALARAEEQVTRAESAVSAARMEASRSEADAQRARLALERVEKVYARQRML